MYVFSDVYCWQMKVSYVCYVFRCMALETHPRPTTLATFFHAIYPSCVHAHPSPPTSGQGTTSRALPSDCSSLAEASTNFIDA